MSNGLFDKKPPVYFGYLRSKSHKMDLKDLWKYPDKVINEFVSQKIHLLKLFTLFAADGIVQFYYFFRLMNKMPYENLSQLFATIITLLIFGTFYGIFYNLIFGGLIKITGKFFKKKFSLKQIYKALSISYYPMIVGIFIVISLFLTGYLILNNQSSSIFIYAILLILLKLLLAFILLWRLVLLIKSLRIVMRTNYQIAIIMYLSGITFFILIYLIVNSLIV